MTEPQMINHFQALLTEYEQLKEEQRGRIATRDAMFRDAMIAVFAAAGAAAFIGPYVTLLIPPICVALGWVYLLNDQKITEIGRFVREELALAMQVHCGTDYAFQWEWAKRRGPGRATRRRFSLMVDLLVFVAPGVVALGVFYAVAASARTTPHLVAAVIAEIALITALAVMFLVNGLRAGK